jgi:hypothetical protein
MDELTVVRDFRSQQPGPTKAQTAAARDLLTAAIVAELAGAELAGAGAGPARPRAARRGARRVASRPGRRGWLPLAGAAAIAAAGVAAVAVLAPATTPASRPGHLPPVQTAAYVLHRAATAAAGQAAGRGRFFVSESEYVIPGNGQGAPAKRIIWVGNGVTGRLVQGPGRGSSAPIPAGISFGHRTISWAQLQHLPTQPGRLLAEVADVSGNLGQPLPVAEFSTITGLLFESPTPPALRSALYLAAARLPGVTLVKNARDLLGRPAAEVYVPPGFAGNTGQALFFDPATSAVLGVGNLVGSKLDCPPSSEYAVLASGYVASKYQQPAGAVRRLRPVSVARSVPGCPKATAGQPTASPSGGPGHAAPSPSPSPSS